MASIERSHAFESGFGIKIEYESILETLKKYNNDNWEINFISFDYYYNGISDDIFLQDNEDISKVEEILKEYKNNNYIILRCKIELSKYLE